jgi:hypothetical protein
MAETTPAAVTSMMVEDHRLRLRKFDGDEPAPGAWIDGHDRVTPAGRQALLEVVIVENDQVVDHWTRGEERDAPE